MTPKPRDWDDVLRRRTAESEEAYQRKMDAVFKALGIDPTKGTPMKELKLFTDPPEVLTDKEIKAMILTGQASQVYDEYYEAKIKEQV